MSLRTRIKGFTAWVNLRLKSQYDTLMSNVIMDLLTGTNMKMLLQSITGRDMNKLQSMDGLSQTQKITRVEWILKELQAMNIIPEDIEVDARLFAMRSTQHIFDLLWRLVSHDIWFVWERAEYLQLDDDEILAEVPFKWTPEPPPKKKKTKRMAKSMLSGFGAASLVEEDIEDSGSPDLSLNYERFPGSEFCKKYKGKRKEPGHYPAPDECILEMVNQHLQSTRDGRKLNCYSLDDLVDSRVLACLLNSFVPLTFTTEILLNDRWTINLVLRCAEKMFYTNSPFDSEDLVEADPMAVCAFFCVLFMLGYKYRQAKAVVGRMESLRRIVRECKHDMEQIPAVIASMADLKKRKELKHYMELQQATISDLECKFDIPFCYKWVEHVKNVQKKTHSLIKQKIRQRFDTLEVPRIITINDLCLSLVINLSLTNGSGFYLCESKEQVSNNRKIVLRQRESGDFLDDFTRKKKEAIRSIMKIPESDSIVVDIDPAKYPQYDIFLEAPSRNKQIKAGSEFLYQVFPGSTLTWQRLLIKGAKDNELDTVQNLASFFRTHPSFLNSKEAQTGMSALHWASRLGHIDIVEYLLESGADIDIKNFVKQTPLFSAIEGMHRRVTRLLIEWGADVHQRGASGKMAFESVRNDDLRNYLISTYNFYSGIVPKIMEGDTHLLQKVVQEHISRKRPLSNLRSRMINGSTLLHTAAYHGCVPVLQELLSQRVDVNLHDYKGATPLHRAKNQDVMKELLDAGALINGEDSEGNTPLHVKCYGETGRASELGCVELLLECDAKLTARNKRGLMPIHCAAMQGRTDAIKVLLRSDAEDSIAEALDKEKPKIPPSLVHLAVANDFPKCAQWLLSNDFHFKEGEQDLLLQRILSEQIQLKQRLEAIKFLLDNGASSNPIYPGGNRALHFAAGIPGATDVLELLLMYGADLDATDDEGNTALFCATQTNNMFVASILIGQGASIKIKNLQGLTALDFIQDFDEWIDSGYFTEDIEARLKAYNLKHARDLIRTISKKVKGRGSWLANNIMTTVPPISSPKQLISSYHSLQSSPRSPNLADISKPPMLLPPLTL